MMTNWGLQKEPIVSSIPELFSASGVSSEVLRFVQDTDILVFGSDTEINEVS